MQLVIAILAVVLGALFAFGGWRFFLILLPFWGLFVGFNIGTEATRALIGDGTFATLTSWAIGLILALVFAIFAYLYYYAAIAVLAGTVGFIIGSSLWGLIGSDDGLIAFILGIALGAVFAIATLMLNVPKYLVIALSAIGGAALVVGGLVHPDAARSRPTTSPGSRSATRSRDSFIWLVVWLGIAVVGFIAQMATGTFGPDSYELDRENLPVRIDLIRGLTDAGSRLRGRGPASSCPGVNAGRVRASGSGPGAGLRRRGRRTPSWRNMPARSATCQCSRIRPSAIRNQCISSIS